MTVWEAHRDLSLSLGDDVGASSTLIPDGVRYTKLLRDSYLYRAMLETMKQLVTPFVNAPKPILTNAISRMLPYLIEVETDVLYSNGVIWNGLQSFTYNPNKDVFLYLNAVYRIGDLSYPLPIKSDLMAFQGLLNSRNIQRPDPFAVANSWASPLTVYIDQEPDQMEVRYLAYPENPVNQMPTERLEIEERYYPAVINLATLFGKIDSQEVDNLDRFMPFMLQNNIMSPQGGQ